MALDLMNSPVAKAQRHLTVAGLLANDMAGTLIALLLAPQLLGQERANLLRLHKELSEAAQAVADLLDVVEAG